MYHLNSSFFTLFTVFGTAFLILNTLVSSFSTPPFPFLYYDDPLFQEAYGASMNVKAKIISYSFHDNGDYYPTIRIGSNGIEGRRQAIDSPSSSSLPATFPWTHSAAINRVDSSRTVPIYINIYDKRDFPAATDDPMNINAQNQYGQVLISLQLDSGIVSGDGIREGQANVIGAGGRQNTFRSTGPDGTIVFAVSFDPNSSLRVKKIVVNDDDGQNTPADFTINAQGRNVRIDPPQGRSQDTFVHLSPGNYEVTQEEAIGYETNYDDGCHGIIRAGQVIVCTIISNDVELTPIVPGLDNPNPTLPALQGQEGDSGDSDGGAGPSSGIPGLDMTAEEGHNSESSREDAQRILPSLDPQQGGGSESGGGGGGGGGGAAPSQGIPGLDMPLDEKGEVVTGDGEAGP